MSAILQNNSHLERAIGTSGFTNGDSTLIGQFYLRVNRASKFQTQFAPGPNGAFTSNNYYVLFDGNGGVSNNEAIGFDGTDTYHATQGPIIQKWIQCAIRFTSGSELKGYYDIAGVNATITATVATLAFAADAVMSFGAAPWTDAASDEYIDGKVRYLKAFTAALTDQEIATEAASPWPIRTSNLWGCWPLFGPEGTVGLPAFATGLKDISGNGRDLSWVGGAATDRLFDHEPPVDDRKVIFTVPHVPFLQSADLNLGAIL